MDYNERHKVVSAEINISKNSEESQEALKLLGNLTFQAKLLIKPAVDWKTFGNSGKRSRTVSMATKRTYTYVWTNAKPGGMDLVQRIL